MWSGRLDTGSGRAMYFSPSNCF